MLGDRIVCPSCVKDALVPASLEDEVNPRLGHGHNVVDRVDVDVLLGGDAGIGEVFGKVFDLAGFGALCNSKSSSGYPFFST